MGASGALRPGSGKVPFCGSFVHKVIEPLFCQPLVHILCEPRLTEEHRKMNNAKFDCVDILPRR
jgi:hypothetical protein